jgi:protein-S-isoprenylcysteine O-methyltransferase Ste14
MQIAASFLFILMAVGLYGLVHSFLASLGFKARLRGWFGHGVERSYRLFYNLFAILTFLPVLSLVQILPDREIYSVPLPWALLMVAVQILAIAMLLVGLWQTDVWTFLGFRQLLGEETTDPDRMVVSGLYRWVRHPLYTAGLLFIWFTPLMTSNLLALNLGLTLYVVIGARLEERKLLAEFGPDYASYRQRTPMLFPSRLPARD